MKRERGPALAGMVFVCGLVAAVVAGGREAGAACNLIPGTEKTFDGTLGATNRPFAAPGEPIELRVRPCDTTSTGFTANAGDHVVTVLFTPVAGGASRNAVVLTAAADCSGLSAELSACQAQLGAGGTATCVAGAAAGLQIVDRDNSRYLRFLFPDTDVLVDAAGDDHTLTGPATIAVSPAAAPLPCQLASSPCAGQSGLIACIDDFFANDGACGRKSAQGTFNHFTALPPPNDFQAACFAETPPCTQLAADFRATTDTAGNVLIPMDWRGILVRQANVPVPRLLRATLAPLMPVNIPGRSFVASYTPEGGILPPIFEPQFDAQAPSGDVTLFGSADAPYTILRIARRSETFQQCSGGVNGGLPCNEAADCPGACGAGVNAGKRCATDADCPSSACGTAGTCGSTACFGGTRNGQACNSDGNCPNGECGPALFDVATFGVGAGAGPLVLSRFGAGVCQEDTNATCATNGNCTSGPCVGYALQASNPVPLEGLTSSQDVFAFVVSEAIDGVDRNGDGDTLDSVATLQSRESGAKQALGAPAGCGISGTPEGRAAIRIQQPPFSFPAVATEGDVVAFLESEAATNSPAAPNLACDENADHDSFDSILRVFRLGGGELTGSLTPHVVDAAAKIDGRSLSVSNGSIFYRHTEAGQALRLTERVSLTSVAAQATGGASGAASITPDGRYVAFESDATNLVPGDTNGQRDAFLYDRQTGTVECVSVATGGTQGSGQSFAPSISDDGRYVAFDSNSGLVPGSVGTHNVFVRDRQVGTTERVSLPIGGVATGGSNSLDASISADGRYVAFEGDFDNLVVGDTNGVRDVFVYDRQTSTTERVSVGSGGTEANGISAAHSISADGRNVAFASSATNLVAGDTNAAADVFVHDRQTGETERVSVASDGAEANTASTRPSISADGRYVAFESLASNLVPGDTNGSADVFVHDRRTGITERVSVSSSGTQGTGGGSISPSISPDGRYVAFQSDATDLVPGDTNAATDVFVHDRQTGLTERVSVATDGTEGSGGNASLPFVAANGRAISLDGRYLAFASAATNLVSGDSNGFADVFVRGIDHTDTASDLTGDGDLDDTVLEALNANTSSVTELCPADAASIGGGMAAFLRPEPAGPAPALEAPSANVAGCPLGTNVSGGISLNDDADHDDDVVHLWRGSGSVENLHCAATGVSLSSSVVAALVDEAAQGDGPLNGDGDTNDQVVKAYKLGDPTPATCSAWHNVGQAADTIQAVGSLVAFLTPEAAQNANLNGPADTDLNDRVLQVYDAGSNVLTNTKQAAEEFVVGSDTISCGSGPLIAFRTSEAAQGNADLNGDGDTSDFVLQVYAKGLGVINTGQAVTPCRLEACDPRQPYRVLGDKVKFLTYESEQGQDLNGDGDTNDLILQVFDACPRTVTVIGTVDQGAGSVGDPLAEPQQADAHVFVAPSGRCFQGSTMLTVPASCSADADCPSGATCQSDYVVAAPASVSHHDTMLLPRNALTVAIAAGKTAVDTSVVVRVRNADVLPRREVPGHTVRLSVHDGTCPAGTVVGLPDFDPKTAGDQDTSVLKGGQTKGARVRLHVVPSVSGTHNPKAPLRCSLQLEASTVALGNEDPTMANNQATLELNVIDKTMPTTTATHESVIASAPPVKLTIAKNGVAATKDVTVKLTNADPTAETVGHAISLSLGASDCPTGTVTLSPATSLTVGGGGTGRLTVAVNATSTAFAASSAKSPARCTATLTATTDVVGNVEPDATNNSTQLIVDVIDKNDF